MSDWWTGYPWRQIQTNLREIDMADIDADRVVADLQRFRATLLMINAAGIIASYPTKLSFHTQSQYLTGDSLATIIEKCHAADIRVTARTDFSKVRHPIIDEYPEWAYRDRDGNWVDYNGDVAVCPSGDYQQKYALQIIEECLTELPFDAIFFNMGGFQRRDYSGIDHGPCHCQACRRGLREMFDMDIPQDDADRETLRKYNAYKQAVVRRQRQNVLTLIERIRPDVCIANHHQSERGFQRSESNTGLGRPLPRWHLCASVHTQQLRCNYPDMVSSDTTVDFIDFPYRHAAVWPDRQANRLVQSLAHGGGLDYYLIGRLDNHADRSGFEPVRAIFSHHAEHEAHYRNLQSRAPNAILSGGDESAYRGWYRALVEHHHPVDVLLPDRAIHLDLSRYELLVLPGGVPLSEELAAQVDAFVEVGGTLLVTGRCDGLIPECLGIERINRIRPEEETRSSYLRIVNDDKNAFPRFAQTDLVAMLGPYVEVVCAPEAKRILSMLAPQPFGPPERLYADRITDDPGFITCRRGKGLAIYVPWMPGAFYWREGYSNTGWFMADLIESVAGRRSFGPDLPAEVQLTWYAQSELGEQIVHLVNHSGQLANTFNPPIPMQDLRFTVPLDAKPATVRSLVHECEYDSEWIDGQLSVEVPRLALFDAVVIR